MQIETKFNVGDTVYCVRNERTVIKKPCNICHGKGWIILKGNKYKCPECSGNGYGTYRDIDVVHKAAINRIKMSAAPNGYIHIAYKCILERDVDLPMKEKNKEITIAEYENRMFTTKEEAEYRCKEFNGEIIRIPNAMIINEFADKIKVRPAEIIQWLFLHGRIAKNYYSEIWFEDMKEFADEHGFICETETEE